MVVLLFLDNRISSIRYRIIYKICDDQSVPKRSYYDLFGAHVKDPFHRCKASS